MADNIGIKIGIEGEKAFKQALYEINSSMKVLGSEMKLVESQFDSQDKSVQALTSRNAVLEKSIDAQKKKIETLRNALKNSTESFGENDSRTKNWAIQLNNAQSELISLEKSLAKNNATLDDANTGLGVAKDKVDDLGEELKDTKDETEDAGVSFEALGKVVKAVASTIAVAAAAISAAAIGAGKALIDMSIGGSQYADEVLTTATVTGIATDKLQEYMYAAELVDVSVETLTSSMAKNIKSMKSFEEGNKNVVDAYERLGVSVFDANGNFRDSDTVYWELIDSLGMIKNETERDALAMTLLGRSAQELNPLITSGSKVLNELGREAQKAGYVLSDEMLVAYGALDDQMQYLKNGATAAKNALGTILLPLLSNLAGNGVDLLGEFTNGVLNANGDLEKIGSVISDIVPKAISGIMQFVPSIIGLIGTVLKSIGNTIVANLPEIVSAASSILTVIVSGLFNALPQISSAAGQIIGIFANTLIENLPVLIDSIVLITNLIVDKIADSLPVVIPMIIELIKSIVAKVISALPELIQAVLKLMKGVAKTIESSLPQLLAFVFQGMKEVVTILVSSFPEIINVILLLITQIVDSLIGAIPDLVNLIGDVLPVVIQAILAAIPDIINAVITIIQSIVNTLPIIIDSLVTMIPQIIQSVITAIIEAIPSIIDAVITLVKVIVQNLPTIILMIIGALPDLIGNIITAIIDCLPMLIECILFLFKALVENLPVLLKMIVTQIPTIIDGIVNALKNLFYKLKDAGMDLVRGFWEGIKSMGEWLSNKVSDFFGGIVQGVKDFLGIKSPSKVFAGIGEFMGEGLGVGFVDSMRTVEDEMKKSIPTEFDIAARSNIGSVLFDSVKQPILNEYPNTYTNGTMIGSSNESLREQLNLIREQNKILRQLLDKDVIVSIGDEEIGRANTRYEKKRGLTVNEGDFSNAY